MIYKNLEIVADLIQRKVKISKKFVFLLMSANKDSLCSGIQTYFL